MKFASSVLDLIGNTPLVELRSLTQKLGSDAPRVFVKVEYFNPGGSVKDRIALRMVEAAEKSGTLRPGGTIVEPTSGNTGVGLALVAQQRGYSCVFVCPDKVSQDKIAVLRAYGAKVIVCPTAVPPDHPDSYYKVSDRLVAETPGAWKPDQYSNPEGPASHYHSTGPEIWRDTDGKVTHFVAGVGTGGTITGTGRYLKEVSDGRVRVIGADPQGSVFSGSIARPYLVEGVGEDFWPSAYDASLPDDVIAVSDKESFDMTLELCRSEGLLVGGSSGMAVVAALQVARQANPDDIIVTLLPDNGRGYLSKIFNEQWMARYGFLSSSDTQHVGDVLREKGTTMPALVYVHPNETVADAVARIREYGISQLPVLSAEPPVKVGEVVGSVVESELLDALFGGKIQLTDAVETRMVPPLPMVGAGESVADAMRALTSAGAALVLEEGNPIGVVTRQDLLAFLTLPR